MELAVQTTGTVTGEIKTRRELDEAHFCALLGPVGKEQTFVLSFNKRKTESLIPPVDFAFSLSISGILGHHWDENQPSAIVEMAMGNRRFVGLREVDPEFRLIVSVESQADKGTFRASHLIELSGGAVISIEGSWQCNPDQVIAESDPADTVVGPRLAASGATLTTSRSMNAAVPARPVSKTMSSPPGNPSDRGNAPREEAKKTRHFRIFLAEPCRRPACDSWTATDVQSGKVVKASVAFSHLKVSPEVLASARSGAVELWISGHAKPTAGKLEISARHLDGVVSRQSASDSKN